MFNIFKHTFIFPSLKRLVKSMSRSIKTILKILLKQIKSSNEKTILFLGFKRAGQYLTDVLLLTH